MPFFAAQSAIALNNARLFSESRQSAAEMTTLFEVTQNLSGTGEIVFAGSTSFSSNFVRTSTVDGGTLDIASGVTIHGPNSGTVGSAGLGLANHGNI